MTHLRYYLTKKLSIIVLSFLVVHVSQTTTLVIKNIPCKENDIEPFIKSLVNNATGQLPNPLPLQNYANFIELKDGMAWGLSTLKPENSCSIICKETEVIIAAHLRVDELKGRYRWQRRMMTRTLAGEVEVKADQFKVFIEIKQIREKGHFPELVGCSVTKMRKVEVHLTGENYVTWPREKITGPAISTFKQTVHDTIKYTFSEAIRSQLIDVILSVQH